MPGQQQFFEKQVLPRLDGSRSVFGPEPWSDALADRLARFDIHPTGPLWGRGIATEAVQAVTEYAFGPLDLVRVQAGIFAWNAASMRVLEKCGYEREGVQRKAAFKDGELVDCVLYARLRPER